MKRKITANDRLNFVQIDTILKEKYREHMILNMFHSLVLSIKEVNPEELVIEHLDSTKNASMYTSISSANGAFIFATIDFESLRARTITLSDGSVTPVEQIYQIEEIKGWRDNIDAVYVETHSNGESLINIAIPQMFIFINIDTAELITPNSKENK